MTKGGADNTGVCDHEQMFIGVVVTELIENTSAALAELI
jgi:hypothetical protein